MPEIKTSIVVLNYNGKQFLQPCFDSILSGSKKPDEVIMVDNHSSDGSVKLVKDKYPKIKILIMPENLGFARAVNKGLVEAKGELIACLNNDTMVEKKWLAELIKASIEYPEAGFFAPKMTWLSDHSFIDNTGIVYSWKGKAYDRGKNEKDLGQYDKVEYVFGACNGASFFRKKTLTKVGLLDENFFLVCDDVDFSFRAQLFGVKCLYVPTAIVRHAGGGTVGKWTDTKAMYSARHHIYIVLKNFPVKFLITNLFPLIFERLRNLSGVIKSTDLVHAPGLVLKTYGEAFKKISDIIKKRNQIQKERKVTDAYLSSIIRRADFSSN